MLRISKFILLVLTFTFVFGLFSGKIWDPDFWWHLKTGEYIYQTGSLPHTDPFAYTSLPKDPVNPESKRIKFILTSYWLAQLVFFLIYHYLGFQGIIFLRASILTLLIFLVYKGIRREGTGLFLSLLILIPGVVVFKHFTGERPQLFSFLLSFLLIYLIEGFRKKSLDLPVSGPRPLRISSLIPVPFLMLLWANLHGGFVLGILILAGYIISETVKYLTKRFGRPLPLKSLKALVVVGISSILVSIVNPNGYNVFSVLEEFEHGPYKNLIVESKSTIKFIASQYLTQRPEIYLYVILLAVVLFLFLANLKRLDLADISILGGLTAISLSAARSIPFFVPAATLMISRYGAMTLKRLGAPGWLNNIKQASLKPLSYLKAPATKIFVYSIVSIVLVLVMMNENLFKSGVRKERYPVAAAAFLQKNRLYGNMLNPYVWGGYLIWSLYPQYKVFIDGRGLIQEIVFTEVRIFSTSNLTFQGLPEWKAMLNAYNVEFIITFSVDEFRGGLSPLIPALISDPEWHLIYMDDISLIFLRDSPGNEEILKRFEMPKQWAWNEVITEAGLKARGIKNNANFYITMGDAFVAKKDYARAKSFYLRAKQIDPSDQTAEERLNLMQVFGR